MRRWAILWGQIKGFFRQKRSLWLVDMRSLGHQWTSNGCVTDMLTTTITVFNAENWFMITEDIQRWGYCYGFILQSPRKKDYSSRLDYKAAHRDTNALTGTTAWARNVSQSLTSCFPAIFSVVVVTFEIIDDELSGKPFLDMCKCNNFSNFGYIYIFNTHGNGFDLLILLSASSACG